MKMYMDKKQSNQMEYQFQENNASKKMKRAVNSKSYCNIKMTINYITIHIRLHKSFRAR